MMVISVVCLTAMSATCLAIVNIITISKREKIKKEGVGGCDNINRTDRVHY